MSADCKRGNIGLILPRILQQSKHARMLGIWWLKMIVSDVPDLHKCLYKTGADGSLTYLAGEVIGPDQIDTTLARLSAATTRQVATFAPGKPLTPEQISATQSRNVGLYDRNIHSRTIYLASVRSDRPMLDHVKWLNERGSEVRTVAALPLRMIIADKQTAIVPLDPSDGMAGIVIHRDGAVVSGLQALFELTWTCATPLGLVITENGDALSANQRTILEHLTLGHGDKEVTKMTGISGRTIRREVAALKARLGAKNRFEVVYKAVKRNLI